VNLKPVFLTPESATLFTKSTQERLTPFLQNLGSRRCSPLALPSRAPDYPWVAEMDVPTSKIKAELIRKHKFQKTKNKKE
jgi:hypothetical protein